MSRRYICIVVEVCARLLLRHVSMDSTGPCAESAQEASLSTRISDSFAADRASLVCVNKSQAILNEQKLADALVVLDSSAAKIFKEATLSILWPKPTTDAERGLCKPGDDVLLHLADLIGLRMQLLSKALDETHVEEGKSAQLPAGDLISEMVGLLRIACLNLHSVCNENSGCWQIHQASAQTTVQGLRVMPAVSTLTQVLWAAKACCLVLRENIPVKSTIHGKPGEGATTSAKVLTDGNETCTPEAIQATFRYDELQGSAAQYLHLAVATFRKIAPSGHLGTLLRNSLEEVAKLDVVSGEDRHRADVQAQLQFLNEVLLAIDSPEAALELVGCSRGPSAWHEAALLSTNAQANPGRKQLDFSLVKTLFTRLIFHAVLLGKDTEHVKNGTALSYDAPVAAALISTVYKVQIALCVSKNAEILNAYVNLYANSSMNLLREFVGNEGANDVVHRVLLLSYVPTTLMPLMMHLAKIEWHAFDYDTKEVRMWSSPI